MGEEKRVWDGRRQWIEVAVEQQPDNKAACQDCIWLGTVEPVVIISSQTSAKGNNGTIWLVSLDTFRAQAKQLWNSNCY